MTHHRVHPNHPRARARARPRTAATNRRPEKKCASNGGDENERATARARAHRARFAQAITEDVEYGQRLLDMSPWAELQQDPLFTGSEDAPA